MSTNPSTKIETESSSVAETLPCPQSLANRIASCALDHYHKQLTKKAKPKPGEEWTVFAAIVAFHRVDNRMWVVSSATGTKCTAQRHNEFIVHDSHAEVLARRGFVRILLDEIKTRISGDTVEKSNDKSNDVGRKITCSHNLLTESTDCRDNDFDSAKSNSEPKGKQYKLNSNIGIHLYISDSPCGDASIYRVPSVNPDDDNGKSSNGNEILYTGAKVIVSEATKVDAADCGGEHQLLGTNDATNEKRNEENKGIDEISTGGPVVAREEVQSLGKLRTKSGRSNLPDHMRSHSHSCSDKIVLWSLLGLQGAMLTKFLNPPVIPLTSVVVSMDSRLLVKDDTTQNDVKMQHFQQQIAFERAIPDRVRKVWECLDRERQGELPSWKPPIPTVHIVHRVYESGKAAMAVASNEKRLSGKKRKHLDGNEESEGSGKKSNETKSQKIPPCGMSFNWNQKEGLEVLVGSRGIKHGKKPKRPEDIEKLASRLCRAKLMQDLFPMEDILLSGDVYHQIKRDKANPAWSHVKNRILTENGSPLAGWLRCVKTDANFPIDGRNKIKE